MRALSLSGAPPRALPNRREGPMEPRIAELEAALRRWRVVSGAALVLAMFSVAWTAVRVLTAAPPPKQEAVERGEQAGPLRRVGPGMRRPGLNGPRRRGPGGPMRGQRPPKEQRESPPPEPAKPD
jgi:hypothetical protein